MVLVASKSRWVSMVFAAILFLLLPQFSGPNIIRNNGPFGVEAGFGSQVTLAGAQITGHTGPAVDIYAHSQLYGTSQLQGLGTTQILSNGTTGDPLSTAIRVPATPHPRWFLTLPYSPGLRRLELAAPLLIRLEIA